MPAYRLATYIETVRKEPLHALLEVLSILAIVIMGFALYALIGGAA